MSLTEWLKAQWLKPHQTSRQEIRNLLGVADRAGQRGGTVAWGETS